MKLTPTRAEQEALDSMDATIADMEANIAKMKADEDKAVFILFSLKMKRLELLIELGATLDELVKVSQ